MAAANVLNNGIGSDFTRNFQRKSIINLMACLCFICPAVGLGHSLSKTYCPLGYFPMLLAMQSWTYLSMILLTVMVETFVLWRWVRRIGFHGNLWRAAVLYLVARASETAMLYALLSVPFFRVAGWGSSAVLDYGVLVTCLVAGLLAKVPAGIYLYRCAEMKGRDVALAVCTASLVGYLIALSCAMMTSG